MIVLDFGIEPLPFIRKQLAQGRTLSKLLLEVPLELGNVQAILPDYVDKDAARRFGNGDLLRHGPTLKGPNWVGYRLDRSEVDPALAQFVYEYLLGQPGGSGIFEHALANASDPWLTKATARFLTFGQDVYLVAGVSDGIDGIDGAMRHSSSYLFMGVLSSYALPSRDDREISPDDLRHIAQTADHILIGAYDGEAELIWSRR